MLTRPPFDEAVQRLGADVVRLAGKPVQPGDGPLAVAVSGGPDSLALLALAAAAFPGRVIAATVDHGLRPESRAEAEHVARLARAVAVDHVILTPGWAEPPAANIQAEAREARYAALAGWATARGAAFLATAHHQGDQAETMLMRLARGAGLGGLAGIRPVGGAADMRLIRPLLAWTKAELEAVVACMGWSPVRDPSNASPDYDRTHARALLTDTPWLDPARLAASASHLQESEAALAWTADRLFAERFDAQTGLLAAADLPAELQRRLLLLALARYGVIDPPGPKVARLQAALTDGQAATLGTIKAAATAKGWRISIAPPRR